MDPESSFELIERAQGGDPAALERLLERYRPRLRRWASGRLPRYARDMHEEGSDVVAGQGTSPLEAAMGAEALARYDSALAVLADSEREAVIARIEMGCSYQEIATLLDKASPDAARMTVARALAKGAEAMSAR